MIKRWYSSGNAFGTKALRFKSKYISPEFYQWANGIITLIALAFFVIGIMIWGVADWHREVGYVLLVLLVVWAIFQSLQIPLNLARILFGPRLDVVLAPDWVKVGGVLFYRTYHTDQYGFYEEDHPKTIEEQEYRRVNPKQFGDKPSLYSISKQLVLYAEDKRIVLASIYHTPSMANRMAMKLNMMKQAVNEVDMEG